MLAVCAWCNKTIGDKDGKGVEGTTHGICRRCFNKMFGIDEDKDELLKKKVIKY